MSACKYLSLPPHTPLARWFCDITLRRLAKTISLGGAPARANHSDQDVPGSQQVAQAEPVDGTSAWGAAWTPTTPTADFTDAAVVEAQDAGLRVSEDSRVGGVQSRFRTFTVVCALTGVTEKGARVAELISPGLMVVFSEQSSLARYA